MRRLAALAFAALLLPTIASAQFVVRNAARPMMWTGVVHLDTGANGPPECAFGCQRVDVQVSLPPAVWLNRDGGLQVQIRWTGAPFDNLRLYVYRDGVLQAKSDGIIAIAQGLLIPEAPNGLYQVYVAFDPDSPSATIAYEGLAEVEYAPRSFPVRRLMPDLEARHQQNLGFDPGGIFFDEISETFPSCYVTEVEEEGAQLCLRFDQIFANVGEGPMELRFSVPAAAPEGDHPVAQRVYWSHGIVEDRPAGVVSFHEAHAHFHFASFGLSRLWRVDDEGRRAGNSPIRQRHGGRAIGATLVRTGRKVSFCLADTAIDDWGAKGDGPRTYIAPDCLFPFDSQDGVDHYVQGITNGWVDIYDWYLPDQYIEVTGIPDGDYVLETIADPDDQLFEADESNNCDSIVIRLSGMATGAPSAAILGPGPACTALGP